MKNCRATCLFLYVFCAFCLSANAQIWRLTIHNTDSASGAKEELTFKSDAELGKHIQQILPQLYRQGFLAASIDSIDISGSNYTLRLFKGSVYKWAQLNFDSIPRALWVSAGINPAQYNSKAINPEAVERLCEQLIRYGEENGYPFARVWLNTENSIKPNEINARLMIDLAERRTIDTLIVEGNVRIHNLYLQRFLDIPSRSLYNEHKLKMLSTRIREVPFLQEDKPWNLHFRPADTRLYLYLKEKKANQLNAILGAMPNNIQTGKLLLTADINLLLYNQLGRGEMLSVNFQNLQANSPRAKVDANFPFLFGSPIGAEAHFDFFQRDLQFRKVSLLGGINYQFNHADVLKLLYQTGSNRIIQVDTPTLIATKKLPENIDVQTQGLRFELVSNHTDYKLNPRKGWTLSINTSALQRRIIPNNAISALKDPTGFEYKQLYDTLQLKSNQYFLQAQAEKYFPLGQSFCIKTAYSGGYVAAPQLFQNELFQIGGFKLLRGFDEQSIFSNQYHLALAELRLRFQSNSYVYLFSDNAWVETRFFQYQRSGWHHGFGLGSTIETAGGLFSIALAFGKSDFQPLRFRESKISFGYVALF